jgi:hypothetical protein
MNEEYRKKYLKYKKKYLELKGGLRWDPGYKIRAPATPLSIFRYIFNMPDGDKNSIDIADQMTVGNYNTGYFRDDETLIKYVLIYSVLHNTHPSYIPIQNAITTYLNRIRRVYVIDYLNVVNHISKTRRINHALAEEEFMKKMDILIQRHDLYIVCGRGNLDLDLFCKTVIKRRPSNLIFIEATNDKAFDGKFSGAVDDYLYWLVVIAFSAFTQSTNFDVNRSGGADVNLPNLILISNDKQKLYDDNRDPTNHIIKNLESELNKENIIKVFINKTQSEILLLICKIVKTYLIQEYTNDPAHHISKYSGDEKGIDYAKYCIHKTAANPGDFNMSINEFCSKLFFDNDNVTNHGINCTNFEKFISVVKYIQFNIFNLDLSLTKPYIDNFLENRL